jgi:transcriptional regulator with XRE-family HTH domain
MDNYTVEIGKRLLQLRTEQEYSLRDVERRTGIPKSTVDSYENGGVDQKIGVLRKLVAFYNEDINWVIGETDNRR